MMTVSLFVLHVLQRLCKARGHHFERLLYCSVVTNKNLLTKFAPSEKQLIFNQGYMQNFYTALVHKTVSNLTPPFLNTLQFLQTSSLQHWTPHYPSIIKQAEV